METESSEIPQHQDPDASYDFWFRTKVQEALDDPSAGIPHEQVMIEMQALIEAKRSTYQPD
ncbi:type II toxin-antitoxin system RelB family antitoxin [Pseudomonas cedrina]|uniref:type II toxin-antitoxin system RelB family antitoxin n=1 Tax=Pseudomonas cedrina TaxID=651740 RepID=UPI003ED858E2